MTDPDYFSLLPSETQIYVLSFAAVRELVLISMTSTHMNSIARDAHLWQGYLKSNADSIFLPYLKKGLMASRTICIALYRLHRTGQLIINEFARVKDTCEALSTISFINGFCDLRDGTRKCIFDFKSTLTKFTNLCKEFTVFTQQKGSALDYILEFFINPDTWELNSQNMHVCGSFTFHNMVGSWLDDKLLKYPKNSAIQYIREYLLKHNFIRTANAWEDNDDGSWVFDKETGSWFNDAWENGEEED